ncbi:MAG TPA: signal peptidase I [Allosphingosinicella sp.]|nr:signal peptidase I [Allosphingosinicella sp.]
MDDAQPDPTADPAPAVEAAPARRKESWWDTVRFLLYLFVGALLLRSFVIAPFSIPSGSMLPNLMIGDYLFIAKWPYGYSRHSLPFGIGGFEGRVPDGLPDRGDIVVFRYPGPKNEDYVKRVIGLPGDRIEVRNGVVILNGAPVERRRIADYAMEISPNSPCRGAPEAARRVPGEGGRALCLYPRYRETLPGGRGYDIIDQVPDAEADQFGPIEVPAGQLFVMGDNRDDSMDSRFSLERDGVGLLPVENVLGEALIGFWSTDGSAEWTKPWTWFSAARWARIGGTY